MFSSLLRRRPRLALRHRTTRLQQLESRCLLAAVPVGATPLDTGEFLLGRVAVTPVLFESNGQTDSNTQNWSSNEIATTLAKISEGVNWWSETLDALDTVHTLDFVVDDTYAATPIDTPYEPIDRTSQEFEDYVGDFLTSLGYGNTGSIERATNLFNHDQRIKHDADWAFTIFVVDSSNDSDEQFADGSDFQSAFAYPGGLFIVTPSTRPASTIVHEMGHIFWARDEYPGGGSYSDRRGYYNAQNLNAADGAPNGSVQEPSIMRGGTPLARAYAEHFSPESTLAMVGWRDSDNDGVFDLADVPLQLDAIGYFDAESSTYSFTGSASAVPLRNQNSSGTQSDITLNRISEIQYSLDGGPWISAASPDQQIVDVNLQIEIEQPFESIRWRAIDQQIGVTSDLIEGSDVTPALPNASMIGFAFLDENGNGERDAGESPLDATQVAITKADGSSLTYHEIAASDSVDGVVTLPADVALYADGEVLEAEIASYEVAAVGNRRVFHAFDLQRNRYIYRWSDRAKMVSNFDAPVGRVEVDAIGLGDGSYGRLEAYDATGNLIGRVTSELINAQDVQTLSLEDPRGRIAGIRFFGHAQTSVAIASIRFGIDGVTQTDATGAWVMPNLPAGTYRATLTPDLLIHQFDTHNFELEVLGDGELVSAAARRINSPRHNTAFAEDVTGDDQLTSRDALVVINDLSLNQSRILGSDETTGALVDVNNDGSVTAADALMVINSLNRQAAGGGGSEGEIRSNTADRSESQPAPVQSTAAVEAPHPDAQPAQSDATQKAFAQWPLVAPLASKMTDVSSLDGSSLATRSWAGFSDGIEHFDRSNYAGRRTDSGGQSGSAADTSLGERFPHANPAKNGEPDPWARRIASAETLGKTEITPDQFVAALSSEKAEPFHS